MNKLSKFVNKRKIEATVFTMGDNHLHAVSYLLLPYISGIYLWQNKMNACFISQEKKHI